MTAKIINITKPATGFLVALKLMPNDKPIGTKRIIHIIAGGICITADLKTVMVKNAASAETKTDSPM